jgi:hypothetical protein
MLHISILITSQNKPYQYRKEENLKSQMPVFKLIKLKIMP